MRIGSNLSLPPPHRYSEMIFFFHSTCLVVLCDARNYTIGTRFPNSSNIPLGGSSDYALGHCGSPAMRPSPVL